MSVTAAAGFAAGGRACGVKPGGRPDVAVVVTDDRRPVPAAGTFTTNRVAAAPVQVSRAALADGHLAAVVLSSGNANAATGSQGLADARRMAELAAGHLGIPDPGDVAVCSTGLIGVPMPMAALEAGIPACCAELNGPEAAAAAILTTDTVAKQTCVPVAAGSGVVGGMAKGAAMLAPAMATMLAVLTTDVAAPPEVLDAALRRAVDETFNQLCVDACTSTNDTVLLLASGRTGRRVAAGPGPFLDALTAACADLATQMARDAEGATVLARIEVVGAAGRDDARRAARAVAASQLVQCSLNGADPYWGRVLSELGASGAALEPDRVSIAYGGVVVCRHGTAAPHDPAALAAVMAGRELTITCDLGLGDGRATVLTTDLSHAYIDENRRTS